MEHYCDYNATAPLREDVLQVMVPFLRQHYGNASSVHALGSEARCVIEEARAHVAAFIGASPAEIVFTSGGTESNNLALMGACRGETACTLVTTAIEHSSVREPLLARVAAGDTLHDLPLNAHGQIQIRDIDFTAMITPMLASIGWANNEIGTVQPLAVLAPQLQERGAVVHVDATQAAGKVPISVAGIDLLSLSAHKLGGPKGVGALYVRTGTPLVPLLRGGGQERGMRAGTENVAGIVGMGEACRVALQELSAYHAACTSLREQLAAALEETIPGLRRNSPEGGNCLPNTLHVSVEDIRGESIVAALDLEGIAVSAGSACAAGGGEPSHVLLALGHSDDQARNGVRFSFGRDSSLDEADAIAQITAQVVQRMRTAARLRGNDVSA